MVDQSAIVAAGVRKTYSGKPPTVALDGFDLEVAAGSVCGLLGPNGAGKTTAVRILATLLRPDHGQVTVAGYDVRTQPTEVRRRIGLVGQHAAIDEILSGRQNLELFGRLYHLAPAVARRRADELLEQFGLAEAGARRASTYSGGMRRRLDLAASLVLDPPVLFLDEPTTGLDPRGRNEVWEAVRSLVGGGTTVLLTTQYLEEADQLADRIAVVDHGRVIEHGTPSELKAALRGDRVEVVVQEAGDLPAAAALVARVTGAAPEVDQPKRRISAPVSNRVATLMAVVRALETSGIAVDDVGLHRPTLDEVFLRLTGRAVGDDERTSPTTEQLEEVSA